MEKLNEMEQKRLVDELNQGRELASQLKDHLGPIISKETCENLLQNILSSYDNALAVLNWSSLLQDPSPIGGLVESPQSFPVEWEAQPLKNVIKKRNKLPKWREQVRVSKGKGLESRIDDGYSWRKYGQKLIFGAKNPRAYYRCTHKFSRSCVATKQVQKSDEDPTIFEVTYKGNHTCMQISTAKTEENKSVSQQHSTHFNNNIGQNLKVETEQSNSIDKLFPSFSFPLTPTEFENLENQIFGEHLDHNVFLGNYSPPFLSPSTSESNYFSKSSSRQMNESDHADMISTPSSVNDSPFDLGFSIDPANFDPTFSLDDLEYLS